MSPTNRVNKVRSLLVGLVCTLFLGSVIFRLLWIQTVDASYLRERAEKTWETDEVIQPQRGSIMDRNGYKLARETDTYIIAADLKQVENPRKTAEQLAPLLDIPQPDLYRKLTKKGVNQVELKNGGNYKVSKEIRDRIMDLDLPGIYPIRTTGRAYLEGELASHVLGFVNVEGEPTGGVEQKYDQLLRGKDGKLRFRKDARGMKVFNGVEEFRPPVQGKDLVLTLDGRIQYQVEKALDQAVAEHQAKAATAIVADPKTGEILAMANRPAFHPGKYETTWRSGVNSTNIAISSQFEPGSTFKIVTLAAAIEEREYDGKETFRSGSIEVGGRTVRDWNDKGWGEITYNEGVYLSSNVAFVHLGQRLGADRLIRYIDRFGFGRITDRTGRPTGIDLPAEGKGYFFGHSPLYPSELATSTFGQGIAVTPIQQVMAVSAIANGGSLIRPHVVKEVRDPETGKPIKKNQPHIIRPHVVSKETAQQVRKLLRGVVTVGTGKEADVKGYRVAGKTGTAQKPLPGGKGYATNRTIASFIGFAPADNPEVVVYVAVDEPSGSGHGGTVAAPVAREIFRSAFKVLGIKPDTSFTGGNEDETKTAGDWKNEKVDSLRSELKRQGIRAEILGSGEEVVDQYPAPGKPVLKSTVYLLTEPTPALDMPDLRGKSLGEALDLCSLLGLHVETDGEGFVASQSIPPGERILDREEIRLRLTPSPPSIP